MNQRFENMIEMRIDSDKFGCSLEQAKKNPITT